MCDMLDTLHVQSIIFKTGKCKSDFPLAEWNEISGKCFSHTPLGPGDEFRSCDV